MIKCEFSTLVGCDRSLGVSLVCAPPYAPCVIYRFGNFFAYQGIAVLGYNIFEAYIGIDNIYFVV